jgi:hypothetical protein
MGARSRGIRFDWTHGLELRKAGWEMPIRPDLVIYSRDNEPSLIVEVKNKRAVSESWARDFRRNLLAHGGFPRAPYFLLVTPDQLYLWSPGSDGLDAPPDASASTRDTLKVFLDALPSERMDEVSLEMVTHAWLSSLAGPSLARDDVRRQHEWLVDSGLFDSIEGGHVELEPAA